MSNDVYVDPFEGVNILSDKIEPEVPEDENINDDFDIESVVDAHAPVKEEEPDLPDEEEHIPELNYYERGRKSLLKAADDPFRDVLASYELPIGLKEVAKDKASRMHDSISQYIRGCLVEYIKAEEVVGKRNERILRRLTLGDSDRVKPLVKRLFKKPKANVKNQESAPR